MLLWLAPTLFYCKPVSSDRHNLSLLATYHAGVKRAPQYDHFKSCKRQHRPESMQCKEHTDSQTTGGNRKVDLDRHLPVHRLVGSYQPVAILPGCIAYLLDHD